jgi:hypothetical protein
VGLGGFLLLEDMTKMHFTCIKCINATITQRGDSEGHMAMVICMAVDCCLFLCWYCDVQKRHQIMIYSTRAVELSVGPSHSERTPYCNEFK